MENESGMIMSVALVGAFSFVVMNATLKLIVGEFKKIYYSAFTKKKIAKYIEDGWEVIGTTTDGYPKTMQKQNEIKVL